MPSVIESSPDFAVNITKEAPPEKPKEKPPEAMTKEQQESTVKNIMAGLGYQEMVKPADKPAEKPAAEEKPKEVVPEKPAEKPADKKAEEAAAAAAAEKVKPKAPDAPLDPEEMATRIAAKIKEQTPSPRRAETPATTGDELTERDQHSRKVLAILGEKPNSEHPEYKTLAERFDAFLVAEKTYKADWLAKHQGKTFNPEDEEHREFYDRHEPVYEQADYDKAEGRLEAREEAQQTIAADNRKKEFDQAKQKAIENIGRAEHRAVAGLIHGLDEKLKAKTVQELQAEDPLLALATRSALNANFNTDVRGPRFTALDIVAEVEKMFTPGLNYLCNKDHPVHQELVRRISSYEGALLQLPVEEQMWNDRRLVSMNDYRAMTPDQQRKHWSIYLEVDSIRALLMNDVAHEVLKEIAPTRALLNKGANGAASPASQTETRETVPPAVADAVKPKPPNTAGSGEKLAGSDAAPVVNKDLSKAITANLWG